MKWCRLAVNALPLLSISPKPVAGSTQYGIATLPEARLELSDDREVVVVRHDVQVRHIARRLENGPLNYRQTVKVGNWHQDIFPADRIISFRRLSFEEIFRVESSAARQRPKSVGAEARAGNIEVVVVVAIVTGELTIAARHSIWEVLREGLSIRAVQRIEHDADYCPACATNTTIVEEPEPPTALKVVRVNEN